MKARELEKRRCYKERVQEVERGTFVSLVFNTLGGVAPAAAVVYKRLASLIAEKKKQPYHLAINLIRCQLSFALIRSAIRCLRGYRSSPGLPRSPCMIEDIQLVSAESHIDIMHVWLYVCWQLYGICLLVLCIIFSCIINMINHMYSFRPKNMYRKKNQIWKPKCTQCHMYKCNICISS